MRRAMPFRRLLAPALAAATALTLAAAPAAPAAPTADLDRGVRALKAAYEHTEGDEGGFDGTLVEQCALDGESAVRCVVVEATGTAIDFPSGTFVTQRRPLDHAVATFAPDGASRAPFAEAPVALDADVRVADRLRLARDGRVLATEERLAAVRVVR